MGFPANVKVNIHDTGLRYDLGHGVLLDALCLPKLRSQEKRETHRGCAVPRVGAKAEHFEHTGLSYLTLARMTLL